MSLYGYSAKKCFAIYVAPSLYHISAKKARGYGKMGSRPKSGRRKIRQPLLNCLIQLLLHRINADFLAGLAKAFKLHFAVHKREERVVGTLADVVARMDVGAALLDKNIAGKHGLTVCAFHAESLGFGITAVTGGTHTFFMREKLDVHFNHDGCTSEF